VEGWEERRREAVIGKRRGGGSKRRKERVSFDLFFRVRETTTDLQSWERKRKKAHLKLLVTVMRIGEC